MELSQIYAPVAQDLLKVEAQLEAIGAVDFPHLAGLLEHTLKGEGKRIRPALTLLSGKCFDYDLERLVLMASALEILHTATLVHDDAIDHSSVRRSRPTVNSLWGEEQAVLLGDYLFAEAGQLTAKTDNLRVIKLFASTLKTISSGEIDQAFHAYSLNQTREQYFQRIGRKTATLFAASTESGAVLSRAPEESIQRLIQYGYNLGIAFQIVDDVFDFVGTEEQLGKPVGSDLKQGTVTLPILLLLEKQPEGDVLRELFRERDGERRVKTVIDLVRNSPLIIEECYRVASGFCERARGSLRGLPDGDALRSLEDLTRYMILRMK